MNLKRISELMKNQYFIVAVITLIALFVRLLNINADAGLWYDELLTYYFSSKSFPAGIIKILTRFDFHMPLYYMFIHVWAKLFGTNDTVLSLHSVMWGVLNIPALFWLGKTYRSKGLGYLLASIGCLSPILIYYSQELRIYSMLICLSTLSVIAFLKLIEKFDSKYLLFLGFVNLMILYIYTIGILFVGIEFFILFAHFYFYKKEVLKTYLIHCLVFFICIIPYLFLLYGDVIGASRSILDPFAFSKTEMPSTLLVLNDLFSPFIACHLMMCKLVYGRVLYHQPVQYLILGIYSLSTLCFLIGFVNALKNINRKLTYLLIIPLIFISVEMFLSLTGSLTFLTRYTLVCFPILLLVCADGLMSFKSEKLKKILISIIFILFIFNVINYKNMTSYTARPSGVNPVVKELRSLNLTKNDYVLYSYGAFLFEKYFKNTDINFINFDLTTALYVDKSRRNAYNVFDKNFIQTTNRKNAYENFVPFLVNQKPTNALTQYVWRNIEQIPKGGRMVLIEDFSNYKMTPAKLSWLANMVPTNPKVKEPYEEYILYWIYNKIDNDLGYILKNDSSLKLKKTIYAKDLEKKGIEIGKTWKIMVFEKQ